MWIVSWKSWMTSALVILMIGWSAGGAAQEKPPSAARSSAARSSAAPVCEVCLSRAEWEIAERDAAKADRFDRLQEAHRACDLDRGELRGARGELAAALADCGARERAELAELERPRVSLEAARARVGELERQRWSFAAGGAVGALVIVVIVALVAAD